MEDKYFSGDKLEFRSIVLEHLKKILEISTREFKKNVVRQVIHSNFTEEVREEDNRKIYIQAVENLSYILLPHFDPIMQKKYNQLIKVIQMFNYEFFEEYNEVIADVHSRFNNADTDISISEKEKIFLMLQLRNAKELFQELNLLLHRVDYLKTAVYGESDDEDDDTAIVEELEEEAE